MREKLENSALPYLLTLVLAVTVAKFSNYIWQYLWSEFPLIKGQGPIVYLVFLGTAISAILWLFYKGHRSRSRTTNVFLALLGITWVVDISLVRIHNDSTVYSVIITLPVLFALYWKMPSADDFKKTIVIFAWVLTTVFAATRILELLHLIPMLDVGSFFLDFEKSHYWLPLSGTIGPDGRWPGPMGHNAATGNVAAFLLVLAVGLKGKVRWLMAAVGVLTLLITSSRTSYVGAVAGLLVLLIIGENALTRRVSRKWLGLGLGAFALIGLVAMLIKNPSLTGRTDYWNVAFKVWKQSPITGIGASGMQSSELSFAGSNSHNLVIDALVKYGLLGALLVVAIWVLAVVITIKAAAKSLVLPLALVVTYIVIGLGEADHEYLGPTIQWLWLVLPVLWGSRWMFEQKVSKPAGFHTP